MEPHHDRRSLTGRRALFAGIWLALLAAVISALPAIIGFPGNVRDKCRDPHLPPAQSAAIIGGALVAFVAGSRLNAVRRRQAEGRGRDWDREAAPGTGLDEEEDVPLRRRESAAAFGNLVLVVFYSLAVALLIYETYAVATPGGRAITSYIRSAGCEAPGSTVVGVGLVAFLLGHWFWYPVRRDAPSGGGA